MKHLLLSLAIAAALPVHAQEQELARIAAQPAVKQALAYIEKNEPGTQKTMLAINAIPAPTFAEAARARDYAERLKAAGLADVHIDEAGNVLGLHRGSGKGPLIVLAAHLDTVYPAATDLTVHEKDGRLYAPGIADNGRSLAAMLTIAHAMREARVQTEGDILFVANVGGGRPGRPERREVSVQPAQGHQGLCRPGAGAGHRWRSGDLHGRGQPPLQGHHPWSRRP
ncbi:M20/M25/M40 family metallo-hydrolase [Pseudoduganella sp. FT26W]|uniref:M20/M25/M40 family metallo-hydrolase n=1 Tax=Duganella aquatilis TaxID=2666082 RepID=A0A844CW47_9BURK|nr:M20/M25/M40 family metallo-hydrolase [Duganella aquatilis]MRW84603.1 M20/M25/M40 family metallo-hydrolase [Duganella aquatilis]